MSLLSWLFSAGILTAAGIGLHRFLRARGKRVVTCPDNARTVAVEVSALKAAAGSLSLRACSRWPEKAGCGQECLAQIAASPVGCLLHGILASWYQGKNCAVCGKSVSPEQWSVNHPALLSPDGHTLDWAGVPPEAVHNILATHRAICFNCHTMDKFLHLNPELAIDRSRPAITR